MFSFRLLAVRRVGCGIVSQLRCGCKRCATGRSASVQQERGRGLLTEDSVMHKLHKEEALCLQCVCVWELASLIEKHEPRAAYR